MTTFLLIHGGSHGAWCWQPLIGELEARGQPAFAFDLPGHGDDPTPRAGIRVGDYLDAVDRAIGWVAPGPVTLVAHSTSGVFVPDAVARHRGRIEGVVFLAAYVLAAGECQLDLIPPERRAVYERLVVTSPDRTLFFDETAACRRFFGDLPAEQAAQYFGKLTPEPFSLFEWRATAGFDSLGVPVRYVIGHRDLHMPADFCQRMARRLGVVPDHLDAGHSMMLSQPAALADLLVEISLEERRMDDDAARRRL